MEKATKFNSVVNNCPYSPYAKQNMEIERMEGMDGFNKIEENPYEEN